MELKNKAGKKYLAQAPQVRSTDVCNALAPLRFLTATATQKHPSTQNEACETGSVHYKAWAQGIYNNNKTKKKLKISFTFYIQIYRIY